MELKLSVKKKLLHSAILMTVMLAGLLSTGCSSTKAIAYLQDTQIEVPQAISQSSNILARPGDRLSIVVNCADPKTAAMFALITPQRNYSGMTGTEEINSTILSVDYQVNDSGNIDFPMLGKVHVAGLTAPQIAEKIQKELTERQLVKDAVVLADFTNLHYSVLGEVTRPGRFPITNNRVTIMEALAAAGDLTIYGRRENVKVVREQNGKRLTYVVDLRDNKLFDSPAYYLQQNDVVYVEPNGTRAGQSTVTENQWKSPGLWISIASLLTTVGVLIFK